VRELLVWSPSVRRFEGWADERLEAAQRRVWRCPVVLGSHGIGDDAAVRGMATQWWGWPHRAGDDWGDAPRWPYVTVSSSACAE
jgi:hypothetical protein